MKFERFWKEYPFFTDPIVRFCGQPTNFDFSFPIYRAREWDGFDLVRENLQYPSKNDCKKMGRANIPYHPVFYGSYSINTAIKEAVNNKPYVLSTWKWKEEFNIQAHLLSTKKKEFESALKNFNILNLEEFENKVIGKRDMRPGSMHHLMLENMHGVGDLFLNEDDYFGSALIGFEELYRTRISKTIHSTDLLIYPSIKLASGINLAIHPEIVDKYLELHSCNVFH